MWTSAELKSLNDISEDYTLADVCTDDERAIIGDNNTRLDNLRNAIFVPMHNRPVRYDLYHKNVTFNMYGP